ncbi:hypothetical protein D8674_005070 [Pyrus ussuriensis x Pyrus communis]|uniref:Pinin-like n=1 Tax=Pyrus ussuriensis x Pyrus communis TaxID=2448454 RepID=A0A5N5FQR8_9ROSA|nr:hypothetical protein D8674_005070 [Pyrus ussuriensis x Pyrus communis]
MSYMQQPPYQMPVYQPEMPSPGGFSLGVPIGGFSGMLAGAAFDVDLSRAFRSQEGSGAHSGSGSIRDYGRCRVVSDFCIDRFDIFASQNSKLD